MELKTLALVAAVILAATTLDSVSNNEFEQFKVAEGRFYSSQTEEQYRLAVFNTNVAKMNAHNADETQTYKMGINRFTDMTQEEFESIMLMAPEWQSQAEEVLEADFVPVGNVNWVTQGAVSRVKDQGRCGSCWAFGAVAGLESAKFLTTGTLGLFSDQQCTSCETVSNACQGGTKERCLNYMAQHGSCTQASYPYTSGSTGQRGTCFQSQCTMDSFTHRGYTARTTYSALIGALDRAPIVSAADASNWSSYRSGIFSNCSNRINHAFLSAGYTSTYTLIKNSWGGNWGESGYIRLAAGNTCGLGDRNAEVVV